MYAQNVCVEPAFDGNLLLMISLGFIGVVFVGIPILRRMKNELDRYSILEIF